jgi:hypothetical protein
MKRVDINPPKRGPGRPPKLVAAAPRPPGRPPGPKHDPWQIFRRELLRVARMMTAPPIESGTPVSVETVTGAKVDGRVMASTVLGVHITSYGMPERAVYIPMDAIDVLTVARGEVAVSSGPPPDDEPDDDPEGESDTDPDLPPEDDEAAPDAQLVP